MSTCGFLPAFSNFVSKAVAGTLSSAKAGSKQVSGWYPGITFSVKCHCLATVFGRTLKVYASALKLPRGRILCYTLTINSINTSLF
jgi:hypothetical protein